MKYLEILQLSLISYSAPSNTLDNRSAFCIDSSNNLVFESISSFDEYPNGDISLQCIIYSIHRLDYTSFSIITA